MHRRSFLASAVAASLATALPPRAFAQQRTFQPGAGQWRTFEITTRLAVASAGGVTRAWIPVPAVNADWQESFASTWTGNMASAAVADDPASGARMVTASWAEGEAKPAIEVVSRVRTRDRSNDWMRKAPRNVPADELARNLRATELIPTDGIVRDTALAATQGKATDIDKVRALYE